MSVYASVPRCKNAKQRCFPINTVPQQPSTAPHQNQDIKHRDRKTRGREKGDESGIEMSDRRGVSGSILQGIYSCADVCVCQALTVNFWAWVETAKCCMGAVGLGGIDGRLGALEG